VPFVQFKSDNKLSRDDLSFTVKALLGAHQLKAEMTEERVFFRICVEELVPERWLGCFGLTTSMTDLVFQAVGWVILGLLCVKFLDSALSVFLSA